MRKFHSKYRIIVIFLLSTIQLFATIVGTTKGEFSVTQGVANYKIEIDVPPGVAGMDPKLSLNYSSNSGNGYMGIGWGVGGLSQISRCSQTRAQDGVNHKFGVKYNQSDRFCLDGQRLMNIRGVYGSNGTEYRTEINNYSKIVSRGSYGGGPRYFDVYTKSGLRYIYGSRYGTYQYKSYGKAMKFWKLDRIIDSYGNTIYFHYASNYITGEHYITKVTYANNSIIFQYGTRADVQKRYIVGVPTTISKRLVNVIVKTGNTEVRRYNIVYRNESSGTKRSKITSITERVAEGNLKTLYLKWRDSNDNKVPSYRHSTTLGVYTDKNKRGEVKFADLDGDGDVDIYEVDQGGDNIWLNNGSGNFHRYLDRANIVGEANTITLTDINGDGLTDIVQAKKRSGVYIYYNKGNASFSSRYNQKVWVTGLESPEEAIFVDLDGDGDIDIYEVDNNRDNVWLNDGRGNFTYKRDWVNVKGKVNTLKFADMNGDGLLDLLQEKKGDLYIYFNLRGAKFNTSSPVRVNLSIKGMYEILLADLNGDGITDIYEVDEGYDNIYINRGDGRLVKSRSGVYITKKANKVKLADINGDGFVDIYEINDGYDYIWLNDGRGFFQRSSYRPPVIGASYNVKLVDLNGDGIADIYDVNGHRADGIYLNKKTKPSLITTFTNWIDQDITVEYLPMTSKTVYYNYSVHGKRNAYSWNKYSNDNIELTTTQPLVHKVKSQNGIGGYNTLRYKYYGFIFNKFRGLQGFHAISIYNDTTQMISGTHYRQIVLENGKGFQYTGLPSYSFKGQPYNSSQSVQKTYIYYEDATTNSRVYEPYTYMNKTISFDPKTYKHLKADYHYNIVSHNGYGDVTKTVERTYEYSTKQEYEKYTYNYYHAPNTTKWYIGRLKEAKVVHTVSGKSSHVRKSLFTYNSRGLLDKEVMNAGTSLALTKTYVYNNRGNKIRETVSGYNLATATTSYGYSNDGKFQTSITDATGLRVTKGYDARFGTVTHLTDVNGLTTKWTYDGLGRKAKEERPDSTITKWHYAWYYNGKRIPHKYSITKYASGQPWQRVYYNSLGKDTITYKQTLNKKLVTNMKLYNAKGEVTKEALPYIADNESLRYIENSYDKFGRLIKIKRPIAEGKTGVETIDYRDFTTITTNVKGQRKETIKNAIGETLKVTDAYGTQFASSMTYTYDATGNLLETKDAHGNRVQMHYDSVGNKIYMNDPDLGIWNYRYAADGKVVNKWSGYKGIDSSKNYTYYMYDKLRRVTRISSSNRQEYLKNRYGVSFNSQIITYGGVYDAQGSRGKLIRHYGFSRYQGKDRQSERETLSYDSLGRLIKQDKYIYGRGNYITQTSYDHYSRPRQLIYPNGYRVNYSYSSEGILQFVSGERRTRWGGKIIYYIIKWRV